MGTATLKLFEASIFGMLSTSAINLACNSPVLEKMSIIQEFYKVNHDSILFLIEYTLDKNPELTCMQLLQNLDDIVNKHFGLDQNINLSDTIYE